MAATISFSKTRVQKVLRAFERRSYYWGETPLAIIEREFGDNAGAFLWHVWREQAYDPTADAALFECMAAAQGCYDARESIALLQRLPKASDSLPRLPPGNATVLHGWCDPLDQMMVHAAHLAPDALRAAWTQLRGGPARDGVALALARAGAITASELPPGATERLAAHGLLCAGQPAYERARAACFASDESFWQALLAAAETATVMSTATLEHLASTAPPRVWVHVAYHVGAAEYADAETATPHVTRLFDAATDDTRAEMRACVDRMLGAADEVSPWRLDVFALGLALAAASAEEPLDPRHDPLLVAALRVETRWPGDCARLRAVLAALPAPRAEAVLVSAAGVLPGGAVRRRQLGARILKSFSAVPTPAVLTAVLDAMDTWDADETHDKLDVAMEGFLLVGTAALPHLDAAESRHRAAAPLYRRIARRAVANLLFAPRLPLRFPAMPQNSPPPRRRIERRDPIAITASLFSGMFAAPVEVAACDLSPAGAFLRSDLLLSPGESVLLAFTVPGSLHRILVDARVVRTAFDERAGMGLEFARLSGAEDKLLRRALDRLRSIISRPPVRDGGFRC